MPVIILDRDGVINRESDDFIKSPEEWIPLPDSLRAIGRLTHSGYHVVVATNQSGIARRKLTIDDLHAIHTKMHNHVNQFGGIIEAIFFCPCSPREQDCLCRKPKPGMLLDIARRQRISLADVPAVGDRLEDIQAARAAGAMPILVRTGRGAALEKKGHVPPGVPVFDNLAAYVDHLLGSH
jgi:D-glycero-D-manno-heptose 1,7-bisphosphate phosphatase